MLLPNAFAQAIGYDFNSYYACLITPQKLSKVRFRKIMLLDTVTKIDNRAVNGLQAVDYQSIPSNAKPDSQPGIGTIIQAGSNVILISTGKKQSKNLEQILSSFTYQQ